MENPKNVVFETLNAAADGAFVVDSNLRIQMWNKAAEDILGFQQVEVEGQYCYQVLKGSDEDQQLICSAQCQVSKLAVESKPVSSYDILVCTNQGEKRWLNMSIITLNLQSNGSNKMIVHLFRDISQKKTEEVFFRQFMETAQSYQNISIELQDAQGLQHTTEKLTRRQKEVLTLLARGFGTQEIANHLFISQNTVRNHIQRILERLQVHSRLEAVTYGLKNGLVD